ncbi:hypothetical protein GGTG_01238 [Gaeumannomyces tritici R3-111a-1]|uniref:Uncharacterized protein n=1 Tax=Gaeumannomyces tritici (strain R3-111a-1) TaxID=644352 RepID=J3NJ04_GAET3|nr:hypothetical protein GGTG_01238 [Gaeumannomyces tritici R3-111a-1]EJT81254.1 hypothetical protein GGTG_01238 [Gaeumannomyces tritici R3-111a-1]
MHGAGCLLSPLAARGPASAEPIAGIPSTCFPSLTGNGDRLVAFGGCPGAGACSNSIHPPHHDSGWIQSWHSRAVDSSGFEGEEGGEKETARQQPNPPVATRSGDCDLQIQGGPTIRARGERPRRRVSICSPQFSWRTFGNDWSRERRVMSVGGRGSKQVRHAEVIHIYEKHPRSARYQGPDD